MPFNKLILSGFMRNIKLSKKTLPVKFGFER